MKFHRILAGLGLMSCVLGPVACRREEKPIASVTPPKAPLAPWTWHALGGLLVVEGEVDEPTELVLKGTTLNERRFVEFGPVRWEMYRPAKGEKAELRTRDGKLLAHWDFDQPAPSLDGPPPTPELKLQSDPRKPEPKKPEPRQPEPKRPEPKQLEPSKPAPRTPETMQLRPRPAPRTPEPKKVEPKKLEPVRPEPKSIEPPKPAHPKPAPPRPEVLKPGPLPAPGPKPLPPSSGSGSTWPGAGEGLNLLRGPRGQRQVCLTFDGGSTSEVAVDVLDSLKARGLRCTFFLTGAFIQTFPQIVRRIDREGHEIGNHTMDHPHLAPNGARDSKWTKERFQQELLAADQAFFRLLGRPMDPLWRAPYGEHTVELRKWAEELGYRHVGWSEGADTLDWATLKERKLYRTGNAILDRLHDRMERQDGDGLIVLMHLGSARPAEDRPARVLGPFLDRALTNGWRFVSAGSYLQTGGKPAWERNRRATLLASGASSASGTAAQH